MDTSLQDLTPTPAEDRRIEIARILSRAFINLRRRGCAGTDDSPDNLEESPPTCLEVVPQKRLTVPAG